MQRSFLCLGLSSLLALSATAISNEARACGGCFHIQQSENGQVTGHRMIFSVSNDATTLWDQISYQGAAEGFAWVLPIHGEVQVALSSDALFNTLDALGRTDEAFRELDHGMRLQRARLAYQGEDTRALRQITATASEMADAADEAPAPSQGVCPIFVLGLPRSY